MPDHPRKTDIDQSRLRQLNEPYPAAARAIDQVAAEIAANTTIISTLPDTPSPSAVGLKTSVPSNYENHLGEGGEVSKSLSGFEVKRTIGRL